MSSRFSQLSSTKSRTALVVAVAAVLGIVGIYWWLFPISQTVTHVETTSSDSYATAQFANGCFWCVEADFEKLPGVIVATSGYADGEGNNPTYDDYGERNFREVVLVTYDPAVVTYAALVEYMIKHGDPTDGGGSFYDRGYQYSPGVYYDNEEEKTAAHEVINAIEERGIFDAPLALTITPRGTFWPAEEYHQDYYKKNPVRYAYYRRGSGRDAFIKKYWGTDTLPTQKSGTSGTSWRDFTKPSLEVLRANLSPLQYEVTQEGGTERPYSNEYHDQTAPGIYVDRVSGEPLFSSKDKYDSGTGWPSFTKPLDQNNLVLREDRNLFVVRTEVRSKRGDSHLGHVFSDGPEDRGGLRWCMNSAALRFIPANLLAEEGYAEYVDQFK